MKRIVIALALLFIATTSYNQTSRKPANSSTADQKTEKKEQPQSRTTSTERTSKQPSTRTESTTQRTTGTSNQPSTRTESTTPRTTGTSNQRTQTTETSRTKETTHTQHNNSERNSNSNKSATDRKSAPNSSHQSNDRTYDHTNIGRNEVYVNQRANHTSVREYESPRVYRSKHTVVHSHSRPPESRDYRAVHYAYRAPVHINVIWNAQLHTHYCRMYPMVRYWDYPEGYAINSVSAYYADYYRGEVMTVYGQVSDVYYSVETDEYFLYYGAYYPYQDFTVIIPGFIARRYNHRPSRYFENQFLAVTGLITTFEGNPEIYVKESFQVDLY